jgi:hypothetical protein
MAGDPLHRLRSPSQAELAEIDENLIRADLSSAERALQGARRNTIT